MKKSFFILFLAISFVFFSCGGDDPTEEETNDNVSDSSETVGDTGNFENDDNSLPDAADSDEENGGKNDADTDSSSKPDNEETTDGDAADDSSGNGAADNETFDDDDADSASDDGNSTDDSDGGANDSDSADDTDTGLTDDDTDAADSVSDADADVDTDSGGDDLEVVLPFGGGTVDKTIKLDTKITKIDVLLMVDLYSSMSAAHDNLKANVKTAIIDGIRAKIPDSAFGLVTLGVVEAGTAYNLAQPITTDTNLIRNAVDGIAKVTSGTRTYHGLALWEAASGEEDKEYLILCDNNAVCNAKYKTINISPVDCSGQIGNIGGACFRNNAMPVFVMASSQNFNNFTRKKFNDDYYDEWRESANGNAYTLEKTAVKAAAKMNEINAKFIGVSYKTSNPADGFKTVAKNTVSQDTADSANDFNISVDNGDENFSAKIAEQVNFLTENIRLDVTAEFRHVDNEYGVADTTQFAASFYPKLAQKLKAGSKASFDITFKNDFYENTTCEPHIFHITVEAKGEGLVLDSRDIKIVVPGKDCGSDVH